MSDRHLCKAKRTDNEEWVEGYYTYYPEGFNNTDDTKHVIRDTNTNPNKLYFVDLSTICQCTGRKDKNGKLIFESDIVKAIYKTKGGDLTIDNFIIKWDKYNCKYVGYYTQKENAYNPLLFGSQTSFEVIGNIFDNPSLLEGGAE